MKRKGRIKAAYESGQALVLVLLSLAVVLTIVLFILSRTVTDVNISTASDESVRAFSAAEAGVEKALVIGSGTTTDIGNASYTASVTNYAEGATSFTFSEPIAEGDSGIVWFMKHNPDGSLSQSFTGSSLQVCWGNPSYSSSLNTTPAIEVSIYYESTPGDLSTIKIARAAFDPYSSNRNNDNFAADNGPCTISGVSYPFSKKINFSTFSPSVNSNGLVMAKIRMFYNSDTAQQLGVSVGGGVLPSQGQLISSEGTAGSSNRKISVSQGWPEFPFGSSAIFTPSGITQ